MIGDRLETMRVAHQTYQPVESNGTCTGCVFYTYGEEDYHACSLHERGCTPNRREDKKEVIWVITASAKPTIEVGIACDGFQVRTPTKTFTFSQEESNEKEVRELFEHLGFDVTITEDY